jgi:hypothetical protein
MTSHTAATACIARQIKEFFPPKKTFANRGDSCIMAVPQWNVGARCYDLYIWQKIDRRVPRLSIIMAGPIFAQACGRYFPPLPERKNFFARL